ncbi:MAG: hypothetical protein ACP5XB_00765 [Isosphaeraceae bacterium]
MFTVSIAVAGVCLLALACHGETRAQGMPVVPIGLDAIRQWERWPVLRIGATAVMPRRRRNA